MIPAAVKVLANTFNKTAGTTLAVTFTGGVTAGNLIVAPVLFDNFTTVGKPRVSSITKMAGETANWVSLGWVNHPSSTSAGAFAGAELMCIQTTVDWAAATYTITLDSSVTSKAAGFWEWSGLQAVLRSTVGTGFSTTTAAAVANTSGTQPQVGDVAIGFVFAANSVTQTFVDDDYDGGVPWYGGVMDVGSTGGSAATNNAGRILYKDKLTASSHLSLSNVNTTVAGNGAIVAVLQPIPEPAITQAAYQFFDDAGTESGAAALAAQNTAVTGNLANGDGYGMIRVRLQSTTGQAVPATDDFRLQWERNASGVWAPVSVTGSANQRCDWYSETNAGVDAQINFSTIGRGQSFLGNGQNLSRVGMWLKRIGTAPGTVSARLYAHSGTYGTSSVGTGTALANATTVLSCSAISTAFSWVYFDFDPTYTLVNGTPYVVEVFTSVTGTDASNTLACSQDTTGAHGGNATQHTTGWSALANDQIFDVQTCLVATPTLAPLQQWDESHVVAGQHRTTLPGTYSNGGAGQTVTGNGEYLTKVGFYMRKGVGSPTGTITPQVFTAASGLTPLHTATQSVDVATLPTSYAWWEFTFNGTYRLDVGVEYIIGFLGQPGWNGSNYIMYGQDYISAGTCAGPGSSTIVWDAPTPYWSSQAQNDLVHRVWTTTPVLPYDNPNLTEGAATTNRLTGGTGTFTPGKVSELGHVVNVGWSGNNFTEILYSVKLIAAQLANADTLRFRVARNDSTAVMTYTQTPTVNITLVVGPVDLVVANGSHGHIADNVTVTEILPPVDLVVAGAAHAHVADNVTVTESSNLVVAGGTHAHTAAGMSAAPTNPVQTSFGGWWDASDAATISATAGIVTQWRDKSGLARHVASGVGPATGTRTLNGLNVLDFTQNGIQNLSVASITLPQPFTWVAVVQYDDADTQGRNMVTAGTVYLRTTGGVWNMNAGLSVNGGTDDALPHVMVGTFNGASSSLRKDGTVVGSGDAGTTGLVANSLLISRNTSPTSWDGTIAEVIIYDRVLTAPELTSVETYLNTKWITGGIDLVQEVVLTVQSATHAHTADNVTTNYVVLAPAAAVHAHTADNVAVGVNLVVAAASHTSVSDNVVLTQTTTTTLVVANGAHAITSGYGSGAAPAFPTPALAYSFDETGTTATDYSGNGNHGALRVDTTPTDLHSSGSLLLDATQKNLLYVPTTAPVTNASVTMKLTTNNGSGSLWCCALAADTSGFNLGLGSNGYQLIARGATGLIIWSTGTIFTNLTPYQIAVTYDGTTVRFYVDGVELHNDTSISGALQLTPPAGSGFTIGYNPYLASVSGSYTVDDVRWWDNVTLTPTQVIAAGSTPVTAGGGTTTNAGITSIAANHASALVSYASQCFIHPSLTYVASAGDVVTSLSVYHDDTVLGNPSMAIYQIDGGTGNPTNRIGAAVPITVTATAGWITTPCSIPLTAGVRYGAAIKYNEVGSPTWGFRYGPGPGGPALSNDNSTGLNTSWSPSGGTDTNVISFYATVSGGGGGIIDVPLIVNLTVQSATHAHTADNAVLVVPGTNLVTQDAVHVHTAANVALGVNLIVQAATNLHTTGPVVLVQVPTLKVNNTRHLMLPPSGTHHEPLLGHISSPNPGLPPSPSFSVIAKFSNAQDLVVAGQGSWTGVGDFWVWPISWGIMFTNLPNAFGEGTSITIQTGEPEWNGENNAGTGQVAPDPYYNRYWAFVVTTDPIYEIKCYYSDDGSTWSAFPYNPAQGWNVPKPIWPMDVPLRVGPTSSDATFNTNRPLGQYYWVEMRAGTDYLNGALQWRMDVNDYVSGTNWTDVRGRTWTLSNSASVISDPKLVENSNLVVQSATHAHTADNVAIAGGSSLAVVDGVHAHTAGNVDLTQLHILGVQGAAHAHSTGAITLVQTPTLLVSSCIHTITPVAGPYHEPLLGYISTPDPGPIPNAFILVAKISNMLDVEIAHQADTDGSGNFFNDPFPMTYASFLRLYNGWFDPLFVIGDNAASGNNNQTIADVIYEPGFPIVPYWAMAVTLAPTYEIFTYYSVDGTTWVQIPTAPSGYGAMTVWQSDYPVIVGATSTWLSNNPKGSFHSVEMRTGTNPAAGSVMWRMDTTEYVNGSAWTDARGRTWTLSNPASIIPDTKLVENFNLTVQNAAHVVSSDQVTLQMQGDLAIQNALHLHSAGNVDLTQAHNITVASAAHAHTADNVAPLYPVPNLVVAASAHLHTADNVALDVVLVVQAANHVHISGNVNLVIDLAVQSAAHVHLADAPVLYPVPDLVVASAVHAHTSVSPVLVVDPAVQSAAHVHTADNVIITPGLLVDNATHLHESQDVSLSGVPLLIVQPGVHVHTAENVGLVVDLVVQSAAHAHSADNVTPLGVSMVVASATHAHAADNLIITPSLIVSDAYHVHTASNVSPVADLFVQAAAHALTSDSPTLVQTFSVVVADAVHAVTSDNVTLTQQHVLVVAFATHAHTADNIPSLSGGSALVVAASFHAVTSTNVGLTQDQFLAIDSAQHGHTATSNLVLTGVAFLLVQATSHLITSPEVDMRGIVVLNNALAVYLDGTPVSRIYCGSALVWP